MRLPCSMGELEVVARGMVDRMKNNLGGEYSNSNLTKAVKQHEISKKFIAAIKKVIQEYVKTNKGVISELRIKDDSTR